VLVAGQLHCLVPRRPTWPKEGASQRRGRGQGGVRALVGPSGGGASKRREEGKQKDNEREVNGWQPSVAVVRRRPRPAGGRRQAARARARAPSQVPSAKWGMAVGSTAGCTGRRRAGCPWLCKLVTGSWQWLWLAAPAPGAVCGFYFFERTAYKL
jgi:hypothetical protein